MSEIQQTSRGFDVLRFEDLYGQKCSVQKSSLATEDCIWLGCDTDTEGKASSRAHLTREMVADLLPTLNRFVQTGELSERANQAGERRCTQN